MVQPSPSRLLMRFKYPFPHCSYHSHHHRRSRCQIFHHQIHLKFHLGSRRPEEASLSSLNIPGYKILKSNPKPWTRLRLSIPSITSAILAKRSAGFIESSACLAKCSYPLPQLWEVGFIESCYIEIIVSVGQ